MSYGTYQGFGHTLTGIQTLKIGGGGFITGMSISTDGVTKVVKTDTYGAYISVNSGAWTQLVTSSSLPTADLALVTEAVGAYEVVVAPGDSSRIYLYFNGYVYVSTNTGATFTRTGFSQVAADPNSSNRLMGKFIAVDPQNADIVYVGTPNSGVFVSANGGTSFSQVGTVGSSTTGNNSLIAFDPNSSVSGGKKQGIYISTYGTGLYHSTDGGTTWTLLNSAGMPTTFGHLVVAPGGNVWVVDSTVGGGLGVLNLYNGSAWSNFNTEFSSSQIGGVAVDPSSSTHVYAFKNGGDLFGSTSSGGVGTWFLCTPHSLAASDVPWLAATVETFLSSGGIYFDNAGKLYMPEGIGVFTLTPPTSAQSITWTSQTAAIEQLVPVSVMSSPGNNPLVTVEDRGAYTITTPSVYPSSQILAVGGGQYFSTAINHGWAADYAAPTPTTLVAMFNGGQSSEVSGKSTDGGAHWTAFGTAPTYFGAGGGIAAASSSNFLVVQSNQGAVQYTTDGGATWNIAYITGVPSPTTSASTVTVGTGAQVFTVPAGLTFPASASVTAQTVDGSKVMSGTITSYSGTTLTINVTSVTGSGSASSWLISGYETGWGFSMFSRARGCCADRVTANKFYAWNYGPTSDTTLKGIWASSDSGVTWSHVSGNLSLTSGGQISNYLLKSVPGNAGNLFFTPGFNGSGPFPTGINFKRSTDGGATWSNVSNVQDVFCFGFGAAKPGGGGYPAIFIYGWVGVTATFSNGSAVISATNNYHANDPVTFSTTGGLPTNFSTGTTYYVLSSGLSSSSFQVSATVGGSAIAAGSAGSGTQSVISGGIWRSDDNASTWTQLTNVYPNGTLDTPMDLEGDANTFGKYYFGGGGSGFMYGFSS